MTNNEHFQSMWVFLSVCILIKPPLLFQSVSDFVMMMILIYWQFYPTSFSLYITNFKTYCLYLVIGWWNGVCVMWSTCRGQRTTYDSQFSTFTFCRLIDFYYLTTFHGLNTSQGWESIFFRAEWEPSLGWVRSFSGLNSLCRLLCKVLL